MTPKQLNKICVVCNAPYIGYSNARKYCDTCKVIKYKEIQKRLWTKYNAKVQGKEYARYEHGKTKCLICGGWVKAPAMHARQKHGVSAREYKETFNLPYTKGLLPPELKELKKEKTLTNGTAENLLRHGKETRFKKGEDRVYLGVLRRHELGSTKKPTII